MGSQEELATDIRIIRRKEDSLVQQEN
jgi:hypothetical protein